MHKKEEKTPTAENPEEKAEKTRQFVNQYARFTGMAFEMLAAIAGGAILGAWLDRKNDTFPVWTAILSLLGIALGLYAVFKDLNRINRKKTGEK